MSLDMNWEAARDNCLEIIRKLEKHIENPTQYLPGNLDQVATVDEFDESKKWELELQELLSNLHCEKDELFFTEHLKKETALNNFADAMIEIRKPVGFDQGVSR